MRPSTCSTEQPCVTEQAFEHPHRPRINGPSNDRATSNNVGGHTAATQNLAVTKKRRRRSCAPLGSPIRREYPLSGASVQVLVIEYTEVHKGDYHGR